MGFCKKTAKAPKDLLVYESNNPFGLKYRLKAPRMKLDLIPAIDLVVLALLFSLLFTRHLMLPGVQVNLPKTNLLIQQNASNVVVLTISEGGMLFFAGSVYEQTSIGEAFQQYVVKNSLASPVLLVKASASIGIQQFLDICKMAQDAGFGEVQVAADLEKALQSPVSDSFILPVKDNGSTFPLQ